MSALVRRPAGIPPGGQRPALPQPGRGPTMLPTRGGPVMPLLTVEVHKLFCGFSTSTPHPVHPGIRQCSGCRVWIHRPIGGVR